MNHFPAKILLFGEHTVLIGGMALARPLTLFSGQWKISSDHLDKRLLDFCSYLKSSKLLDDVIDLNSFYNDILKGLTFDSQIPIGYGVGSSGALTAAVMKRYALISDAEINDIELRKYLAHMESFFHGQSSGLDPLIIFRRAAVLVNENKYDFIVPCPLPSGKYSMFLVDTGISRSTGPLVKSFLKKSKKSSFKKELMHSLIPAVETAIESIIEMNYTTTFDVMKTISKIQMELLSFLIHDSSIEFWKEGIESNYFRVKLCGAGGGGFLLGMTNDWNRLLTEYPNINIIKLTE